MKPKHSAFFIVLALVAVLVSLYCTSCASIPYRASLSYSGASVSYDGKRVLLDVNGNEVSSNLRGYAK